MEFSAGERLRDEQTSLLRSINYAFLFFIPTFDLFDPFRPFQKCQKFCVKTFKCPKSDSKSLCHWSNLLLMSQKNFCGIYKTYFLQSLRTQRTRMFLKSDSCATWLLIFELVFIQNRPTLVIMYQTVPSVCKTVIFTFRSSMYTYPSKVDIRHFSRKVKIRHSSVKLLK